MGKQRGLVGFLVKKDHAADREKAHKKLIEEHGEVDAKSIQEAEAQRAGKFSSIKTLWQLPCGQCQSVSKSWARLLSAGSVVPSSWRSAG